MFNSIKIAEEHKQINLNQVNKQITLEMRDLYANLPE